MTGFAEVSDILWRERELLDLLLFKLESEQLLLGAGEVRWLARSTREVELVLEQLRLTEVTRAIEVGALASDLGLPEDSSLAVLAEAAPSPWGELFLAHRVAFTTLIKEITEVAEANRAGLLAASAESERVLARLGAGDLAGLGDPPAGSSIAPGAAMTADRPRSPDVDDEHTRLLTYRSAAAAAADRIDVLAILLDGLTRVLASNGRPNAQKDDAGLAGELAGADALAVASTAQMMNQANFRAALGTLVSPVQRSLVAFIG